MHEGLAVSWYWSDDMARAMRASDVRIDDALERRLRAWELHPVAYCGPEGSDVLDVARGVLGMRIHRLDRPPVDADVGGEHVGSGAA